MNYLIILCTIIATAQATSDPAVGTLTLATCTDKDHFATLNGCQPCDPNAFRNAYKAEVTGSGPDAHGPCCQNPHHSACKALKHEWEQRCGCDAPVCFNGWNPYGINVMHMDLTSIQSNLTTFNNVHGESVTLDHQFDAVIGFASFGSDDIITKTITSDGNKQLTIDCTDPTLTAWCISTKTACDESNPTFNLIYVIFMLPGYSLEQFQFDILTLVWDEPTSTETLGGLPYLFADQYNTFMSHFNDQTGLDAAYAIPENSMFNCWTPPGQSCPAGRRRRLLQSRGGGC